MQSMLTGVGIVEFLLFIIGLYITIEDIRKLKVKTWLLLLYTAVGIIGAVVVRCNTVGFSWLSLLVVPCYVVLCFINTKFNNNKIIGQADVDILNGSLSLLFALGFMVGSQNFGEYTPQIQNMILGDIVLSSLVCLIIGLILALILGGITELYRKIRGKESPSNFSTNTKEEKKGIRGWKVPVCVGFMPMFMFYVLTFITLENMFSI